MIDSLSGFELALAPTFREDFRESLSRMVAALAGAGVTVLMTSELEDRYTDLRFSPYGTAFLTDAIIVQRYIEVDSRLRRVMAVVKVRASAHSDELRVFSIDDDGIHIGDDAGRPGRAARWQADEESLRPTGGVAVADPMVEPARDRTMNDALDRRDNAASEGAGRTRRLNRRVEAMRAVLAQLLQDVSGPSSQLEHSQATQLLEANEHLVVSALGALTDAETANGALDEATRRAELDPLTGLPNRTLLLDRFENAISNAKRHGNRVALLFLDLNNFKQINDTFGHAAGDRALQLVADCLASWCAKPTRSVVMGATNS